MKVLIVILLLGSFAKADEIMDIKDELCNTLASSVHAKRVLKKQKEIQAMTGTYNKVEVYEAGKTLTNTEPKIESLEVKHKLLTGERLGFGECPVKYRAGL